MPVTHTPTQALMPTIKLFGRTFEQYITASEIQQRVNELAKEINRDFAGKNPLMIVVLNGAFIFASDLLRRLNCQPEIQFIRISTYGNSMSSSQTAQIMLGLEMDVENRDVIIIEDIIDTGYTTDFFIDHLSHQNPSSVHLATLLFKPDNFVRTQKPRYVGFEISPEFVVGYGMDYAQHGRELPDIYRLQGAE